MFNEPQKLLLPDVSGHTKGVVLQVNWNKAVAGAKYIKLKFNDEVVVVRREHLEALLFIIGDKESQAKFVKSRTTTYNRKKIPIKLFVKMTKDMRKNEMIVLNYYKDVPSDEAEEFKTSGKILVT